MNIRFCSKCGKALPLADAAAIFLHSCDKPQAAARAATTPAASTASEGDAFAKEWGERFALPSS